MLIVNQDFSLEVETKDNVHIIDIFSPRIDCTRTIIVPRRKDLVNCVNRLKQDFRSLTFGKNSMHNAATITGYFIS